MKRTLFIALFITGAFIAACKSGEGERCQVDNDCTSGLTCNKAKNTCQSTSGGGIDAFVPPQIDAAVDAPHD